MALVTENLPTIPEQFVLCIDAQTLGELAGQAERVRDLCNANEVLGPFELQGAVADLADIVLTLLRSARCLVAPTPGGDQ